MDIRVLGLIRALSDEKLSNHQRSMALCNLNWSTEERVLVYYIGRKGRIVLKTLRKILLQSMMLFVFKLAIITKLLTTLWKITKLTMMSDEDKRPWPGGRFCQRRVLDERERKSFLVNNNPQFAFCTRYNAKRPIPFILLQRPNCNLVRGNNQQGSVCLSSCLSSHVFLSLL